MYSVLEKQQRIRRSTINYYYLLNKRIKMNEQSQHMPMDKKIERLNKIYISTFEYIKKNSSKKDPKFQEIKERVENFILNYK